MEKNTTELTIEYIKEHPYIKACLKQGLINYSSLSRHISKELNIEKKTSMEAILIAARRFHDRLQKEFSNEKKIKTILAESELEIKNKITSFVVEKNLNFDSIETLQKKIRSVNSSFFLLEGSTTYTIITQEKFIPLIRKKIKARIIESHKDLALINFKTSKDIVDEAGVIAYLTGLFAENGVNITDLFSCWTDNLFLIDAKEIGKAIEFLKF